MRAHFAFIESNTTGTGKLAVERLVAQGQQVTFITRQPGKYPFLAKLAGSPGLQVLEADTNDREAMDACVRALTARTRVDALLTFSTFYVPLVAELAARYGFRYLHPGAARICHEKHEARKVLRAAGQPTPEFWLVTSEAQALQVSREATYPCVVKPTAESGSTGVRRVDSPEALLAHYRALASRRVNERGQALAGEVLVEGFLTGPEFSVETVTLARGDTRVIGVTRKHLSAPPHFVELGHDFPAPLDDGERQSLERAVVAALDAVGFDLGPAHTEIRLCAQGPVVIEINPRLAGGMIPELVRHATGIDLLTVLLEQLLGRPVDLTPRQKATASIRFLTASGAGRLAAVHGVEDARHEDGVREVSVDKAPGVTVRPPESSGDRLGHVIASGEDRAHVERAVTEALGRIRFDVVAPEAAA
ncbi:ATP-grasp domain-containing protein [Corallococcus sp. AB004]|nr:ATP-grasp domain-containing protein [Corallococcus sp. AB004]